jgi:hypothetical protein
MPITAANQVRKQATQLLEAAGRAGALNCWKGAQVVTEGLEQRAVRDAGAQWIGRA